MKRIAFAACLLCAGYVFAQSSTAPPTVTDVGQLGYLKNGQREEIVLVSPNGEYSIRLAASNGGASIAMTDNRANRGHRSMTLLLDDELGTTICLTDAHGSCSLDPETLGELRDLLRPSLRKGGKL